MNIGVAIAHDRARHVALHLVAPHRLGRLGARERDVEEERSATVARREHLPVANRRRDDVHPPEGLDGALPEDVPGVGIDRGEVGPPLDEELPRATDRGEQRRREGAAVHAAAIIENAPQELSRSLVELAEAAAGLDEDGVVKDQRARDEAEGGEVALEILDEVDSPHLGASLGIEADEEIAHPGDIDPPTVDGRRGADPGAIAGGEERHRHRPLPAGLPQLLPRRPVERPDMLRLGVAGLGDVDDLLRHQGPGIAWPEIGMPELLQPRRLERVGPGGAGDGAVTGRAAPLEPGRARGGSRLLCHEGGRRQHDPRDCHDPHDPLHDRPSWPRHSFFPS